MESGFLTDIRAGRDASNFGKKGQGLYWLAKHKLTIPETLVLTFKASERLNGHQDRLIPEISKDLIQRIDPQKSYAVRSSANLEDGQHISFAGQFLTKTNVSGISAIQRAIQEVLASRQSAELEPYFRKLGENGANLRMAVLIQEMVDPIFSGVAFSKNPTTGLDEVVIEAVQGLGENLVQYGITPDRWIFRWGQFTEQPDGKREYDRVIQKIAVETKRIAKLYGKPVDLEWAYDGKNIYWLQIRPITVSNQVPVYSNRIAREVLPGIIKPLISSINIPLVNTAWIRLFDLLLGPTGLKPEELTQIFHYRAYFNMGTVGRIFEMLGFPRESLEMLLGFPVKSERPSPSLKTFRHLPRLLRFAINAWNYDRRVEAELKSFEMDLQQIVMEDTATLSEQELMQRIQQLFDFNIKVAYQNIVIPLLMNLYNALIKSQLLRAGIDIANFDVTAGLNELKQYDPNAYLDELKQSYENYPPELKESINSVEFKQLEQDPRYAEFGNQVSQFMRMFGHLSENGSDFSRPPWREDPDALVRMILSHPIKDRDQSKKNWETANISWLARWRIRPIYTRARRMRLRREQISSIYTASYGSFRILFMALAERLVKRGVVNKTDDIFFLTWPEIQALVDAPPVADQLKAKIKKRRQEVAESVDVALPETIYGNSPPPVIDTAMDSQKRKGIPTSPGYYQGPLKIVLSIDDFGKVQTGDVIAIPYSDVAWTPLFAKAGAVIAEAGGILSHSSIVAREYGIPCIVSVSGATNLPQNSMVYVDGYQGEVGVLGSRDSSTVQRAS